MHGHEVGLERKEQGKTRTGQKDKAGVGGRGRAPITAGRSDPGAIQEGQKINKRTDEISKLNITLPDKKEWVFWPMTVRKERALGCMAPAGSSSEHACT